MAEGGNRVAIEGEAVVDSIWTSRVRALWDTASTMADLAEQEDVADPWKFRASSLVFLAFALEAWLNHHCAELFGEDRWEREFEQSLKPRAKLLLLAAKRGIEIDSWGHDPWQSFDTCFKLRNACAHSKTGKRSAEKPNRDLTSIHFTPLHQLVSSDDLTRFRAAADEIIKRFAEKGDADLRQSDWGATFTAHRIQVRSGGNEEE